MREKTKDNFEKGIFWELYKDLERQLESFLEYVPYLEGNELVYSFKLLNLIRNIGGHVDSAFKEMAKYPKFSSNEYCRKILRKINNDETVPVTLPLEAFETEYQLSQKEVIFKRLPEREKVMPFKPRSSKARSPHWWKVYNGLKHHVTVNIKEANLKNARDALAGAFLINVIHKPAILRLNDYGVLKWPPQPIEGEHAGFYDYALTRVPRHAIEEMLEGDQSLWGFVETPVFIYNYDQR